MSYYGPDSFATNEVYRGDAYNRMCSRWESAYAANVVALEHGSPASYPLACHQRHCSRRSRQEPHAASGMGGAAGGPTFITHCNPFAVRDTASFPVVNTLPPLHYSLRARVFCCGLLHVLCRAAYSVAPPPLILMVCRCRRRSP